MKKEYNISSANLIKTILIFSLIILSLSLVYAAGSAFEPTAPPASQTTPTQAGSAFEPTTGTGAPTTNPLTGLWNTIKTKFSEATNWADNQLFGEEIPSIFSAKWWDQGQWNNQAWWTSTFCAADTRTNQGYLSGLWDWLMRFIGARSSGCYEFWIQHGLAALFTAFWTVLIAKLYVYSFCPRKENGELKKEELPKWLILYSGIEVYGKRTANVKKIGLLSMAIVPLAVIGLLFFLTRNGRPNSVMPFFIALVAGAGFLWIIWKALNSQSGREVNLKSWIIPMLIVTIVIWVLLKIAIIKFLVWPLLISNSYIFPPMAAALWIVWIPIWQAEKEKRKLKQMQASINVAGIKAEFFGSILNSMFKGYFEGMGKGFGGKK